jgi:hypothetical protein
VDDYDTTREKKGHQLIPFFRSDKSLIYFTQPITIIGFPIFFPYSSASSAAKCKLSGAISTRSLRLSDLVKNDIYFTWATVFDPIYGFLLVIVYLLMSIVYLFIIYSF